MPETDAGVPREGRWRDLPPVEVPVEVPRRVSQTFLRTHDRCSRAGYLYLKHEGGPGSAPLNRGSIFHRFAAKATHHLIAESESRLPHEVGKDLLLEVLRESPELTVPAAERDSLRAMVWNWCEGSFFYPETIIAVEQSLELPMGEWTLRGKVDLAEQPFRERIDVTDYKTSFAMTPQDEFEGDFQTTLYALLIAFGTIDGAPLAIGAEAQEFGLRMLYPRYLTDDGLAMRYSTVARSQLLDFRLDLEAQLDRLAIDEQTGKWQPTPGSHCSECPAPYECPLPRQFKPDSQLAIENEEVAQRLAEWWLVTSERARRVKDRIKKWAAANHREAVPIGRDLELRFVYSEHEEIVDKDELFLAVEGAVEYGHPFERAKLTRTKKSTKFEKRKVKRGNGGES